MRRTGLDTSVMLAVILSAISWSCSDDDDGFLSGIRPSTPEYAVGIVKNENVEFKFVFTETWQGKNNNRIVVSEDTVSYILTVYNDSDSVNRSENWSNLSFSWNERTREIHSATCYFYYNKNGIQYKVEESELKWWPDMSGFYTVTRSAEVDLEILRFNRDPEAKHLLLDFILRPDVLTSDLEFETTITGSIKVSYQDYP